MLDQRNKGGHHTSTHSDPLSLVKVHRERVCCVYHYFDYKVKLLTLHKTATSVGPAKIPSPLGTRNHYQARKKGGRDRDRDQDLSRIQKNTLKTPQFLSPISHHLRQNPNPNPQNPNSRRRRSMDDGSGFNPRTPEEVFRDFRGRRSGIIRALTDDVQKFHSMCDPEKENLCLYGYPNETWEVNLPAEEVPPELPEPALGINFARDGMVESDWLSLVAVHSDAWLLSVAFYFGARFMFDKEDRRRLFTMINNLPTIYEVVTGAAKKQSKEKTPNSSSKGNKSNTKTSRSDSQMKASRMPPPKEGDDSGDEEDGEEDEDEHGNTLCGACGDNYATDEFWICCDICEMWFHGKCVKITPARAEHIKQYKCPSCSNKRARVP